MKVIVYTNCPTKEYLNALYYLNKKKKIKLKIIDSRALYLIALKIYNHCELFRKLIKIIFKKEEKIYLYDPNFVTILQSILAPFTFLFLNNFIFFFTPYNTIVYYLIFLKFLRKKMIFLTTSIWQLEKKPKLPLISYLWKKFFKNLKIVGVTKKCCKGLEKYGAISYLIPHSINLKIFKPKKLKQKSTKKIRVLNVGRLIKEKGILEILEIAKHYKNKNVEFIFVGDGPLVSAIRKAEGDLPVKYLGYIKDKKQLAKIYNSCDIFLLNSYEERFGIALVEAMACGLAVIATDCVGPKEIINNGYNGLLVKRKNKKDLFEKLQSLIENKNLREFLGKNARKSSLNYSEEKIAKKWICIMGEVFEKEKI